MDRGLYVASSGGLYNARRLDITANNLANVNTVGYKAERLLTRQQEFSDTLASQLPQAQGRQGDFDRTPGVINVGSTTDFTPGPIAPTGNPLDVALAKPNHFFVVQTKEGEVLTRAGNFTLDTQGNLVTRDGYPVLGDGGPLQLPPGDIHIAANGAVSSGKETIGKLRVVMVDDTATLSRVEGTRFKVNAAPPQAVDNYEIVPESVEMPNVSVVEAMVDMINAQKGFEAYTKTAKTFDELNERSLRNARLSS